MRVIGTAGHVDHGKSTLVQAITGVHPDRLKEEREREMTIDLGFAWFTLPSGEGSEAEEVGIIDVPGHRDFIENMLSGVGGIDAALFVVAADEGVMPQTREHLAILDILQIPAGVVALTKTDLVDDPDWLELVATEVRQALVGTVLEKAPIIPVSARTAEGIPELLEALRECLSGRPARPDLNRPRLPIDRVFTIAGFGTVVTGTLVDGQLHVGEEVEVLPSGRRGRIRGLQTHKQKEETAIPGGRTAANISGITVDQVRRGDVLAHPGDYTPTRRLDVRFRLLPDASLAIAHNAEVKLFIGSAEVVARLRLLGSDELLPGDSGWLQLETEQPVVAVRGDHYILRRPSPGETLGGGVVVDPHPRGRHKRFAGDVFDRLDALSQGTPEEILFQALLASGAAPVREVLSRANLPAPEGEAALQELLRSGQMVAVEMDPVPASAQTSAPLPTDALVASKGFWDQLSARLLQVLADYHRAAPLRPGMPKEELRSRLKPLTRGSARLFAALLRRLVAEGKITEAGPLVLLPGHAIRFTPEQQRSVDALLARFAAAPFSPPSVKDSQAAAGEELFEALLATGQLVGVAPDVVFRQEDYQRMVAGIRQLIQTRGEVTAAEVRDHFNTSRKYALALLEHLDAVGLTQRSGDARRLRS